MTAHALLRISQRWPHLNPGQALKRLSAEFDPDSSWTHDTHEGCKVSRVCIGRDVLYPVRTPDGAIKTVLAPGMTARGPNGTRGLKAGLDRGVYQLPPEDYHRDPCAVPALSSSMGRKLLKQSPRHVWAQSVRLNPDPAPGKDSKAFDIGRAAHRVLLGRGEEFVAVPDELLSSDGKMTTKPAKEFVADARGKGQTPLTSETIAQVQAMVDSVQERLAVMGIEFDPACSELTALAEVQGVWCRIMADNAPIAADEVIYDFKTCTDASYEAVAASIQRWGYDFQGTFYTETWEAATGQARPFVFVFVEKTYPHEVCVIELSGAGLEIGKTQTQNARFLWRQYLGQDRWPGYPAKIQRWEPPAWYESRILNRKEAQLGILEGPSPEALARARKWQSPEGDDA